jgi:hypothetical protein
MAVASPIPGGTPIREPADYRGTVRFTNWAGGYDEPVAQHFAGEAVLAPAYWESNNIDVFSMPGTMQLSAKCNQIDLEASDHEYLMYPFNVALYRIPMANFSAALFQKVTSANGLPVWQALTNVYPGAVAPRGAVVWRDQLVVASGETVVRFMSKTEVWTTQAAPAGVTAPICGQVGAGQDDRLLVWWEGTAGAGLYAWDGTAWSARLYPSSSTSVASTCDALIRGLGSTLIFLRDATGTTTLVEYAVIAQGTQFATPMVAPGLRVYPQCATVWLDSVWIVGKLQAESNIGVMFRKGLLEEPETVAILDTNFATDDQTGLDWSWRCVWTSGDALWLGGSSRENHDGALYRLWFDPDSDEASFLATSTTVGVPGPIYSIAPLPPGATGASTTERLHLSSTLRTWYKDRDNGSDPTLDADSGFLQLSDIDLGVADHLKIGRFIEAYLKEKSAGGTVTLQYRVDPQKLSDPWSTYGVCAGQGLTHLAVPDDNPATQDYGQAFRTLQVRIVFTRATSGTVRDVLDTLAYDIGQIRPLQASAA